MSVCQRMIMERVAVLLLIGVGLVVTSHAQHAEAVSPAIHAATCRDSRVSWSGASSAEDAGSERKLRLEVDADGDGLVDVLEAGRSSGSGFSSTYVQLTLGVDGAHLKAEETFAFTAMTAVTPVPKELLASRHSGALAWVEEALFPRVCESPDPSLAWLLDPTKRLTWIDGPPEMPAFYAIRLPARRLAGLTLSASEETGATIDPSGEVWLTYAGHVHTYPDRRGHPRPVELAREGDRVLLGTAHGVILSNPARSRHAWVYVYEGNFDVKLRVPSIGSVRLDGETAIITLKRSLSDQESLGTERKASKLSQVRVNLTTGAVSK